MRSKESILNMPRALRPRERTMDIGAEKMEDRELLAILLGSGYKDHSALALADRLLEEHGGVMGISKASSEELMRVKGIGPGKACSLLAAFELADRRISPKGRKVVIRSSQDASHVLEKNLRGLKREHFQILLLNTKNHLLGIDTISIGSLNSSIVHPRELFASAIRRSAAAIILAHNHPSGDATPSKEDIEVTRRIRQGGQLLGIEVIDHIIIGEGSYYSFREEKMI